MKETYKLINFREMSRSLHMNERRLGHDRIPEKHKEAFSELYEYLERFVSRVLDSNITNEPIWDQIDVDAFQRSRSKYFEDELYPYYRDDEI